MSITGGFDPDQSEGRSPATVVVEHRAVLFDLWGTLVPAFPKAAHQQAMARCARILGLDPADAQAAWVASFPGRVRGDYPTLEANFAAIAAGLGVWPSEASLTAAAGEHASWTARHLTCPADVGTTLRELKAAGHLLGLVTNCAPDVPPVLGGSPIGEVMDICAFSCSVGAVKPEPAIYESALSRLGCEPGDALYVGDGSDDELAGARALGMAALLVTTDLSDTYDRVRPGREEWTGPRAPSVTVLRSGLVGPPASVG